MIPVNSYVVQRSIEHYGKDVQSTVCMEECAELIQAISKEKRGKSDKDHLEEEIADVIICIEMLKQIYNITEDEIYSWVITKQERIIRRIEKDTQSTKTNAERIRNMTDEELAEWLTNMCDIEMNEEPYKSIYNLNTEQEEEIHDSYGDLLKWLQSEAEVIELKDATEIVKQGGVGTETETIRDKAVKWNNNSSKRVPYEFIDYVEGKREICVSDNVCEWELTSDGEFIQNPHTKRLYSNEPSMQNVYCNTCGKKIKIVGD